MLVQVSLFSLEDSDRGLSLLILGLLGCMIALHFFLRRNDVPRQCVPNIGRLSRQILLQLLLLLPQRLDLPVVKVELLSKGLAGFFKSRDFALKSGVELLVGGGSRGLVKCHTATKFYFF